jgi:Fe-S-cluster-containing dehydrogenase component
MNSENESENENKNEGRREFLLKGLIASGALAVGALGLQKVLSQTTLPTTGHKNLDHASATPDTILFTPNGKVFKAHSSNLHLYHAPPVSNEEARKGIAGKKFVMVIDLAKCDGCKKCTEACQAMHHTDSDREWIKVYKMKDGESETPYFMPKPCFHCDNPPCTKVCPVGATFKRQDGIVLIDNERCIGCRSCMVACPYSTRFFNWGHTSSEQNTAVGDVVYSPEQSLPRRMGTVEKCDFCPDMIRQGKMPACVSGCPMNAIYFGDQNENAVTNASGVTVKFSQLLEDNAGFRRFEELGTEPRVYYLPPKGRKYPHPEEQEIEHPVKDTKSSDTTANKVGMKM